MIVYHGSTQEIRSPDVSYGRCNLDFGRGFYVTTLQAQAEKWARRRVSDLKRFKSQTKDPTVSVYEFTTDGLKILTFDGYTEQWLDFVLSNRTGQAKPHRFDAIYGNMANDEVAATINYYLDLSSSGRIEHEDKMFFLRQLQYQKQNNQYCIATTKGIGAISFIKSYNAED